MKAISRWLDRFCYNHPNFGIPGLMLYIAIGNAAVYLLDMFTGGLATNYLFFHPALVAQGQIWRIFTFVFIPQSGYDPNSMFSLLWFAMSTFFYYWLGTALERQWGTARFSVFYGLGILLNLLAGTIFSTSISMYYVNMSLFFSFATLYPDMQVLLYGIIPLKVKWLAWFDAAFFAVTILRLLTSGTPVLALFPVLAILNYLIFFWEDLAQALGYRTARAAHRASRKTISFHKAQQDIQQRKGYLHKCAVCGITDADDPNMEFRYCSKCNGYYCYCMNHINNHTHVE